MKKFLLFMLVFILILSSVPAFASNSVQVELDGVVIPCRDVNGNSVPPLLIDGTTYVPVRSIATYLELNIVWDDSTKSVFIEGTPEKAEKTNVVNIYIKGQKFIATDVTGQVVNPILKDGTTYLPIRAIGEAFNKRVSWENETKTVKLSTPKLITSFSEHEIYIITNKASQKAISVTDSGLKLESDVRYEHQCFKFIPSDTEGYYYIQSVANGKNFDVNGNSKNPGAKIITYNPGTADNQKFAIEQYGESYDDYIIYSLSSKLPIEDSAGTVKQNTLRESDVQRWDIQMCFSGVEPGKKEDKTTYYLMAHYQSGFLYDINGGIFFGEVDDGNPDSDLWSFIPNENGEYIITNKDTQKSLDVANNSKTSGDPIITYKTSGDPNQRWTLEKQEDGSYLIKSVHSGLYLSVNGSELIHAELNESYKQSWILSPVK